MSTVTVRLNKEESKLFNDYAEIHDMPLSTILKEVLKEKLEDEYDMELIKEYENNENEHTKLYTHEEVKDILGI